MIYYENKQYSVSFYTLVLSSVSPVIEFIESLPPKHQAKIFKYIDFLRFKNGILDEPYSRHIKGKIRELRVDFGKNKYRIFYFTLIGKRIVMLHGFIKKTNQTPIQEISMAEKNYSNVINNLNHYEKR